ncbi:MAG: hypothetical protein ACE5LB_13540, partial [Acidiferrobacterales bacterium]
MPDLPHRFCVTKVGPYSKQLPDLIIQRKNNERYAGRGVFWWGFGANSDRIAASIRAFGTDCEQKRRTPHLVFIEKKTKDHHGMGEQVIWCCYKDLAVGKVHPPPRHVIMLRDGSKTSKYYALLCHSKEPLYRRDLGCFRSGQYQNLNGPDLEPRNSFGRSQTTSVVRRRAKKNT